MHKNTIRAVRDYTWILQVLGRVELDAYINNSHVRTRQNPLNQGHSATCYAHAIAGVVHLALVRIVGREGGHPTVPDIRNRILQRFPPECGGRNSEEVLKDAVSWYRPLRFRRVDEEGARMAVIRRRPVLTTFRLSKEGWRKFCTHFDFQVRTAKPVLTPEAMASCRSFKDGGGHAVVMVGCRPRSLTFLNSWGRDWGDNGTFSVQESTVLQRHDWLGRSTPVQFYDVYWVESDLTEGERQAFRAKADESLRARARQVPGVLELEARCPHCHCNSSVAEFRGNVRRTVCPRCQKSFAPEPEYLVQALHSQHA